MASARNPQHRFATGLFLGTVVVGPLLAMIVAGLAGVTCTSYATPDSSVVGLLIAPQF